MRKFDLRGLGEDIKVVVNCKTEEDAIDFLEYLDIMGFTWYGNIPTREDMSIRFNINKDKTCFNLNDGNILTWGSISWYKANGYKILDLSEIEIFEETPEIVEQPSEQEILNKIKEYNSKLIPQCNFQKSHHIHYIKFPLTENLSIRYFFSFQNQPEKSGKFYMKNHKEKTYSEIDIETVKELLSNFCKEKGIEIIGRRVGKNYRKVIISEGVLISEIE